MDEQNITIEQLKQSIISMAVEAWRFRRTFEKAMSKVEPEEGQRYLSQFNWFIRKVDEALKQSGMNYVNLEGQVYSEGMAVNPLNIDEFEPDDELIILQMLEPVIMEGDTLKKDGTAILGRIEK